MSDDRLYGLPYAEYMETDLAAVWENVESDYFSEDDPDCPARKPDWKLIIEEWTAVPARNALPDGETLAERVIEWWCEETTEDCYDKWRDAADLPDVTAAFQAAVDLLGSKVSYLMADRRLDDHVVTFDGSQFLVDGEPMYRPVSS